MLLKILVPSTHLDGRATAPNLSMVRPRSAIVGRTVALAGLLLCHWEGNEHGAANVVSFADRLLHAAGRAFALYPTKACGLLPAADLIEVGTYDARRSMVVSISDPDRLQQWCGEDPADVGGERLPAGPADRHDAARLLQDGAKHIGTTGGGAELWYLTRGRQVLLFDTRRSAITVDPPDAAARLKPLLNEPLQRLAFGK